MSVANEVRSEVRDRSTAWRRCNGRGSGVATTTSTAAATRVSSPSGTEVCSTRATTTPNANNADAARPTVSESAPYLFESPEATDSTSPVGSRWPSTCPICVALRVTSFVVLYSASSQPRTANVCIATPTPAPTAITPSRISDQVSRPDIEPAVIPSSTARPTRYGPSAPGRKTRIPAANTASSTSFCRPSSQMRNRAGGRVAGEERARPRDPADSAAAGAVGYAGASGGKSCIAAPAQGPVTADRQGISAVTLALEHPWRTGTTVYARSNAPTVFQRACGLSPGA